MSLIIQKHILCKFSKSFVLTLIQSYLLIYKKIFQKMFYAVPLAAGFGGFMYYLGRSGFLQNQNIQGKPRQITSQTQKQSSFSLEPPQKQSTVLLSAPRTKPKTETNNTFNDTAVTPILRNLTLNPYCKMVYSTYHKTSLSVHQLLTLDVISGTASRYDKWIVDTSIQPIKFAVTDDYYKKTSANANFGFDRGHMAASSNYCSDQKMRNQTNKLSNIIPQNAYNNQGNWKAFEDYCRKILENKKCDSVEVISGPIFNSGKKQEISNVFKNEQLVLMENGIVVPPRLYKVIKCNINNLSYASVFTFSNKQVSPGTPKDQQVDYGKKMGDFQEPFQQVENQTGLVFTFKDNVKSLTQFDKDQFVRTTRSHIQSNFQQQAVRGADIEQLNQRSKLAAFMSIGLEQQKERASAAINQNCEKQFKGINGLRGLSECQKLHRIIRLHKMAYYLNSKGSLNEFSANLEKQINNLIIPCFSSKSGQVKEQAAELLRRSKEKSRFRTEDLLNHDFFKKH